MYISAHITHRHLVLKYTRVIEEVKSIYHILHDECVFSSSLEGKGHGGEGAICAL